MNIKRLKARPVIVEAVQWTGNNFYTEIKPFTNGLAHLSPKGILSIETTEGTIKALPGCWVIKGTHGEFYPVRANIVETKYDILEEEDG